MEEDIIPFSDIIVNIFDLVKSENTKKVINIYREWKKILKGIKLKPVYTNLKEGENLSDHSRIVDLKNGILFVEVDHPGWIEVLNIHKNYILIKMRRKFSKLDFKTLAFCLKTNVANDDLKK